VRLEGPSGYRKEPNCRHGRPLRSSVFPQKNGNEFCHGFDERITQEIVEDG
jgi:hypothetical protein